MMPEMNGTITRRLDHTLNDLFDEFKIPCSKDYIEKQMSNVRRAWKKSNRNTELRHLFDMLDANGISYEQNQDCDYYQRLVDHLDNTVPEDIGESMILALFEQYQNYPDPNQYMKRLVDRLSGEEDPWRGDPLRLRILKRFIGDGNYLQDADYAGRAYIERYVKNKIGRKPETVEEILASLDDEIFDVLETATRDQRKKTYSLIRLADDLGTGKFRVEGSTKKGLYMFAMVYNMTYSVSQETLAGYDPKTDIEKNLFQDYYTNNLLRFLSDTYRNESGQRGEKYEMDPTGQGINYKNFAEMIYIYFISRDDLTPQEKIKNSSQMIKDAAEEAQTAQATDAGSRSEKGTDYYRGLFGKDGNVYSEDILKFSEPDFKKFILQNYNCNTQTDSGRIGVMQVETTQNSAYAQYKELIKQKPLELCMYGLTFTPGTMADFGKNFCAKHPDIDADRFQDFCVLLSRMDDFIMDTSKSIVNEDYGLLADNSLEPTRVLLTESPSEITRTSLIIAFYYYFNDEHEDEVMELYSFEDFFNMFKEDADAVLTASYYQPISGKNFFDVLLVFSAYSNLFF